MKDFFDLFSKTDKNDLWKEVWQLPPPPPPPPPLFPFLKYLGH